MKTSVKIFIGLVIIILFIRITSSDKKEGFRGGYGHRDRVRYGYRGINNYNYYGGYDYDYPYYDWYYPWRPFYNLWY